MTTQNCEIKIQYIQENVCFLDKKQEYKDVQHLLVVLLFPYYYNTILTNKQTNKHTNTNRVLIIWIIYTRLVFVSIYYHFLCDILKSRSIALLFLLN